MKWNTKSKVRGLRKQQKIVVCKSFNIYLDPITLRKFIFASINI